MNRKTSRILKRLPLPLLLVLVILLTLAKFAGFGCATRYTSLSSTQPPPADLLEGNWLGKWSSTKSDMSGQLRCRIEKSTPDTYLAHFDATFAQVLSNKSTVTLKIERSPSSWSFTGEEDLGLLKGGVYKYAGSSDGLQFSCTYDSKFDKGTFQLTRQAGANPPPPSTNPN